MITPTDAEQVSQLRRDTRYTVRDATGRWSGFVGLLLFLVIWSGFVYFLFKEGPRVFFIIFSLGWLIAVYAFIRQFMLLFSPYYELRFEREVDENGARPGDSIRVFWKRKGGWGRPVRIQLWLVGKQIVVTQGERATKVEAVFFEQSLEDQTESIFHEGDTLFQIPFDVMPSFAQKKNALQWSVQLEVGVARRPNFRLAKLFYVLPYRQDQLIKSE